MAELVEFKVTKTLFDDVKNDQEFRIGFEAEFHVRNASDLLLDRNGYLPQSFETFNNRGGDPPDLANSQPVDQYNAYNDYADDQQDDYGQNEEDPKFHSDTALIRLAALFSAALGLEAGSISTEDTGYTKWRLMLDSSLYRSPNMLSDADHDLGVELVSPVMPLKDGLAWISKVFGMIASFKQQDVSLYTTAMCGFHVNLSHLRMGVNFDFAKLAILSGDQHYLQDFERVRNQYAAPLMQAVYSQLVTAKERPGQQDPQQARAQAALNLLNIRGWSPSRVMTDLAALIPMDHWMSVDFRRLDTTNPYIEIRIAGNAGYEKRFDEVGQLTVRFGALIKIGCDPYAYREEYLKKIYQLVAGVTTAQPQQGQQPAAQAQQAQAANPFARLRIYLSPIMSTVTRHSLDVMETYYRQGTLSIPNGSFLALAIIRSAIDLRQQDTARIRQGIATLIRNVLRIEPLDLLKSLKNNGLLQNYGVVRQNEKALPIITMLTNYIKSLNRPIAPMPLSPPALTGGSTGA